MSYVRPILGALRHPPLGLVEIDADGVAVRCTHCFVFNVPRYAAGLRLAPRALSDDGLLDWVAFERPGRGALVRYAMAVWRCTHLAQPDVLHGRARHLRLVGTPPMPIQLDGDPAGFTPVEIEVRPEALAVLVS